MENTKNVPGGARQKSYVQDDPSSSYFGKILWGYVDPVQATLKNSVKIKLNFLGQN
jgi:hypothetical protein